MAEVETKNNGNKKRTIIIAAVAVLVVAAIASVIFINAMPKGVKVAVSNLPDSLNPILPQNTQGLNANELIFDGLCNNEVVEDENGNGALVAEPCLAEEIEEYGNDKKTFLVTLNTSTEWHDSTQDERHYLTSQDVIYSFDAYALKENESPNREYFLSFIEKYEAQDDSSLIITFKKPIPLFRVYSVLASFKIVPASYKGETMNVNMREGENERNFATEPVGTGPFKFSEWKIERYIAFDKNAKYENFTNKRVEADTIVIEQIVDPEVRLNELRKGNINLILETNPLDRQKVLSFEGEGVYISSYMPYAFYDIQINTQLFPKADARQAIAMALNKEELIPGITDQEDVVVINSGIFPSNILSKNVPEYYEGYMPAKLQYNIAKAKKLASTGGIAGQNAMLKYPENMGAFGKQLADAIAKQLEEIGLNVEVKKVNVDTFKRDVSRERKNYELALMYHDGFDNWYSSIGSLYRGTGADNVSGISDKKLNSLFAEFDKQNETQGMIDVIDRLETRFAEDCPAVNLLTLQKDVYARGLKNVVIASDNPFLSAEKWIFGERKKTN